MDWIHGMVALVPLVVADTTLDGPNVAIGLFGLFGLAGLGYLIIVLLMTPQPSAEPPSEYPDVDRLVVPLLLPVGVALTIAAIIFLTSQILLVVNEAVATPIALGIALFVLVACSIVATAPKISKQVIYPLIGLPLLVLVIAGGISAVVRQNEAREAATAGAQREANEPLTALNEITTDDKFSKTSMISPAGQAITLTQNNKGAAIHNWHVLDTKDANGKDITTQLTNPGSSSSVTFTINTPGTYKFQCDVHPTEMFGTLKIE